jgi:RNA recognition motif-containing protein
MNLFVSNLGEQITEESLRAVFATYGEVHSSVIMRDQISGLSKCFGFVDMPHQNEAQAAIHKINGSVLNGRSVSVEPAALHQRVQSAR